MEVVIMRINIEKLQSDRLVERLKSIKPDSELQSITGQIRSITEVSCRVNPTLAIAVMYLDGESLNETILYSYDLNSKRIKQHAQIGDIVTFYYRYDYSKGFDVEYKKITDLCFRERKSFNQTSITRVVKNPTVKHNIMLEGFITNLNNTRGNKFKNKGELCFAFRPVDSKLVYWCYANENQTRSTAYAKNNKVKMECVWTQRDYKGTLPNRDTYEVLNMMSI